MDYSYTRSYQVSIVLLAADLCCCLWEAPVVAAGEWSPPWTWTLPPGTRTGSSPPLQRCPRLRRTADPTRRLWGVKAVSHRTEYSQLLHSTPDGLVCCKSGAMWTVFQSSSDCLQTGSWMQYLSKPGGGSSLSETIFLLWRLCCQVCFLWVVSYKYTSYMLLCLGFILKCSCLFGFAFNIRLESS